MININLGVVQPRPQVILSLWYLFTLKNVALKQ